MGFETAGSLNRMLFVDEEDTKSLSVIDDQVRGFHSLQTSLGFHSLNFLMGCWFESRQRQNITARDTYFTLWLPISLLNEIPLNIRHSPTIYTFKKKLKDFLLNRQRFPKHDP